MTSRRWMATFFVAALVVYAPGIWWGLPVATAPGRHLPWGADELGPTGAVNELYGVLAARQPTFNPQYPLFHYLCQFAFVAPYYAALWATGHISHPEPNFPYGTDHPPLELGVMTILARLVSLLMGAGVVAVAFRTGEVLRDRRTGILAALCVLVQYPMFHYARTSNVDMGALFWTALGLLVFAQCMADGMTPRRGIALGIFAALATASKDASYGAFLPVGAILIVLHARAMRRTGTHGWEAYRAPAYAMAAALAVYVVASGLVLRPSRYWQHIHFIRHGSAPTRVFYFRYEPTLEGYLSFGHEMLTQLVDSMGLPMLLCAAAGVVLWAVRDRKLLLWLLPAVGVFVFVLVPVRFVLLRFALPIVYVLAFSAADVLARGLAGSRPWHRPATLAALVVAVGWAGVRGADLTYQMLHDSRYAAAEWMTRAARAGDTVGHITLASNLPALPEGVRTVRLEPTDLEALSAASGPDFIISIPIQDFEPVHERHLPEEVYQRLVAGTLGYRRAALVQGPTLFAKRPATVVNPPVRIFMRNELWESRMGGSE
jgi:4-amino-4-deoxy-L-arabinose transferase-like glycosyltransferase